MSVLAVASRPTEGVTDDRDLVAGVRAGDDRAFELLFARYQPRIVAYVRRIVRDEGRAEDITQEVFLAALRRMREETERDIHFKPWIFEIAKNRCIDAYRRTRNASEVSFDAHDAIRAEEQGRLAGPGATPDSAVEGKVALDNLRGAFGGLSPEQHEILVLREFEGLSYREIGERLGMSRPAVESALFRARKRLSEEYEELVSGERCLRVQRLVDEHGRRAPGLRDRRRMARHLAHCQPCRRHACRAGVDLGAAARPPAAAAGRIAAFLPLPAFLRRRWGADDAAGAPLLGHGGPASQWYANLATTFDPGAVSGWTKAVATAATVAVAGVGAGAAITHRTPFDFGGGGGEAPRSAPARSGGDHGVPGARPRVGDAPGRPGQAGDRAPGGRTTGISPSPGTGAGSSGGADPSAPAGAPEGERGERRALGSSRGLPAATGAAPIGPGDAGPAQDGGALGRVIGSFGDSPPAPAAAAGSAPDAAGSGASGLLETVGGTTGAGAPDQVSGATGGAAPTATGATGGVTPTVPSTVADTTTAPQSLGG